MDGVLAQLVERLVRNEKVRGSNPLGSTSHFFRKWLKIKHFLRFLIIRQTNLLLEGLHLRAVEVDVRPVERVGLPHFIGVGLGESQSVFIGFIRRV